MLESADASLQTPLLCYKTQEVTQDAFLTCLSLPEGLLQPVRPHILAGLAHRQLLAAHLSPEGVKFSIPEIRQDQDSGRSCSVRNAVTHIPGGCMERRGEERTDWS